MQLGFSYRHVSLLAALLVLLVQSTTVVMAQEQVAGEEKGAVEEEMVAEEKVVAEDKAAAPSAVSVAVLNFETKAELEETAEKVGENVSAVLTSLLSGEPQLLLVERAELTKLLSEQSLSISGTVDTESAATIGKLTGADVLITGRMFTAGNQRVLVAKIMGTETSRVFGEMVSASVQQPYVDQVVGLAEKIKATLGAQQSVLTVPQEEPDDIVARLAKLLEGKTRPTIAISINERSYSSDSIDPAAETEVGYMLKKLGFTVLDSKTSTKVADITVTGEAFSEVGLKKGDLVSARARVELKAIETKNGNVLATDRQTDVAVDLSDRMAEKTALQSAAAKLAERVIPALVKEANAQ